MKNALESYDEEERLDATVSERHQNFKGCPIKQIKPDPRPEKFGEDVFRSEECITDGKVEELWG